MKPLTEGQIDSLGLNETFLTSLKAMQLDHSLHSLIWIKVPPETLSSSRDCKEAGGGILMKPNFQSMNEFSFPFVSSSFLSDHDDDDGAGPSSWHQKKEEETNGCKRAGKHLLIIHRN